MEKKLFGFMLALLLVVSCVPEDFGVDPETGEPIGCSPVASIDALVVKVTSQEPLPEELLVSINDGQSMASEKCLSDGVLNSSEDRKEVTLIFPLVGQLKEFYYPGDSGVPIEDYADFHFFTKESCAAVAEPLYERRNIVVNWQTSSFGDPRCKNSGSSGFAQFRYNP